MTAINVFNYAHSRLSLSLKLKIRENGMVEDFAKKNRVSFAQARCLGRSASQNHTPAQTDTLLQILRAGEHISSAEMPYVVDA